MKYANKNIMGHPNFKYSNYKVLVFTGAFYLLQRNAQNRKNDLERHNSLLLEELVSGFRLLNLKHET
ncbi:MAG: hypothetical protein C0599_10895 [Salinivirgaceae bacterium]|nr:MAG: hypothetical protein C0599_10895 [Salinivirgaceae bacterium]